MVPGFQGSAARERARRPFAGAWGYEGRPRRTECVPFGRGAVDTPLGALYSLNVSTMSASKIQIGQLWKKEGTKDIYLVTKLYSEALSTMVILRKSGAENEAQIRVRVERAGTGQTIPGFSPAQDD
jgi:hypothetical protein